MPLHLRRDLLRRMGPAIWPALAAASLLAVATSPRTAVEAVPPNPDQATGTAAAAAEQPASVIDAPPQAPAEPVTRSAVVSLQPPGDSSAPAVARQAARTPREQFFLTYGTAAVASMKATGVPASVTLAQAALESDWGASRLTREANNFFGIKSINKEGTAGSVAMNTWEVVNGENIIVSQLFRAYRSPDESFVDHGLFFLENRRYAAALAVRSDARAFARGIADAGYATDPGYAAKLIGIMDQYNLYQWDALALDG